MKLSALFFSFATIAIAQEARFNGFDVFDAAVPTTEIFEGGVPRDGIEALSFPKTVSTEAAELLDYQSHSEVISYTSAEGVTRAYPLAILRMHEVINDEVDGEPILVTYCPLCKTAMIFSRKVAGRADPLTFGVSGLLHNSDLLIYDRETESLWTQLGRRAITGALKYETLEWLPSRQLRINSWAELYPEAEVVSVDTGKEINYRRSVYAAYHNEGFPIFDYAQNRDDLPEFDEIYGMVLGDESLAVSRRQLRPGGTEVTLGGEKVTFSYDREARLFTAFRSDGTLLPSVESYWFAWQAFHPKTRVLK